MTPLLFAAAGTGVGLGAAAYLHLLERSKELDWRPRVPARWGWLVVVLSAALWAAASAADKGLAFTLLTGGFGTALAAAAATDIASRRIPNRLVLPAIAASLVLVWAWPGRTPAEMLAGGLFAFAVMTAFFVLARGGLGAGDVKLAALVGLVTGFPAVVGALFVAVVAAAAFSLLLLALRRATLKSSLAYGPFLVAGALVALLWPPAA